MLAASMRPGRIRPGNGRRGRRGQARQGRASMRPGRIRPGNRAAGSASFSLPTARFNEAGADPPRKLRVSPSAACSKAKLQ